MEVCLNFKETELCLGIPGSGGESNAMKTSGKRGFSETVDLKLNLQSDDSDLKETVENSSVDGGAPPLKDPVKPPAKYIS